MTTLITALLLGSLTLLILTAAVGVGAMVLSPARVPAALGDGAIVAAGDFRTRLRRGLITGILTAFVLIADKLVELNERLVQSPHVAAIEVPLPDREEREQFVPEATDGQELSRLTDFTSRQLAEISNGLSLTSLNVVLAQAARTGKRLDSARFRQLKKSLIERQCQGLVEFIEPKHTLDLVVGLDAAKQRLQQDAKWIGEGRFEAAPMGAPVPKRL